VKAADKLKALAGANARESMRPRFTEGQGGSPPAPGAVPPPNRLAGIERLKGYAVPLDRITPDPDQPRKEFDHEDLERLAADLKARGQVQPVRVRWSESDGKWILITGERRYRAAKLAGLATLQAVEVQGAMDPDDILEEQLVENCLRSDLKPVEQARAFQALMNRHQMTQTQVADRLHLSQSAVAKALALLSLPEPIRDRVDAGEIAPHAARELRAIRDPEEQARAAEAVARGEITGRDVAEVARRGPRTTRWAERFPKGKATLEVDGADVGKREFLALARQVVKRLEAEVRGEESDAA
jgi:ParB family chromosome partitioning protein